MSDETPGAGQSAVPREGLAPKSAPVRIAQIASGQYVVASQSSNAPYVPQLGGIAGTQQGIQHILNISPSRVSQQTSPLRPSQTSASIVKALTKTSKASAGNVRLQLFQNAGDASAPTTTANSTSRTATKRILTTTSASTTDKKDVFGAKVQRVLNHHHVRTKIVREKYNEKLLESYHINLGCNLLDLYQLAKRPKTLQFVQYMNENSIDPKDVEEANANTTTPPIPTATAASSLPGMSSNTSTSTAIVTNNTVASVSIPTPAPTPPPPSVSKPPPSDANTSLEAKTSATASSAPTTPVNPEQIVEKAKHEAIIVQRINDLQKEGLWTEKRLPKVQEMPRIKTHWDYMLEEMVWLAADFAQERKWKKAAARKCSRMVQKYFQEKAQAAQKAEKAQEQHMRRVAAFVAKEVKNFWGNVEKLVEFKQNTRLEEKRKQALDQHLSFIVDQTEKYSQLLAEGMNKPLTEQNSTSNPTSVVNSDDEFRPDIENSEDDEETIAQEEAQDEGEKSEEIAALQRESQMDFDDFLSELPKDYLQHRDNIRLSETSDSDESEIESESRTASSASSRSKTKKQRDEDFTIDSSEEDDENTIHEQEQAEGEQDHAAELCDLNEEAEMDIEELRRKYANMQSPPLDESSSMSTGGEADTDGDGGKEVVGEEDDLSEVPSDEDEDMSEESAHEDDSVADNKSASSEMEVGTEIGLKSLLEGGEEIKTDSKNDLINDAAAIAESIQPKGNTLSSTSVVTPIPFLLKFTLREYQHIGLDWLVTMFERQLNGILADEMGLGKTIQTIALLAHLACEKGNWGPHLVIVPTSVMLNWEMECKKWCPGFKILTYYGTQKERKLKRIGWTKPNAFHVCITSYKLVIQDHQSFRRKKWKYLILDEAQNIKNFKSQRWQLLLNFNTQQRLLLTGTPLQNNLMELWSLMHFLMPNVFQSHREFKEWFSNPVTGMIEGNAEYNENIIKRLHKVLRPFLLRRLKCEVEKQMPKKFEHVIMCRLSKRQRFLYDDYMSRTKTKETLATGNLLSVINVLMQLRKVCNHPNLFESRPTISPFQCDGIVQHVPALVYSALEYDVWRHVDLKTLGLNLLQLEFHLGAYQSYRLRRLKTTRKLIEVISSSPKPAICPPSRLLLKIHRNPVGKPIVKEEIKTVQTASGQKVKLIQHPGGLKAVQIASSSSSQVAGKVNLSKTVPSYAQLVETLTGKHILFTPTCNISTHSIGITGTTTVVTSSGQKLTLLPKKSITSPTASNNQIAKAVVKVHLTSLPNSNSGSPITKDNINVDVTPTPRKPIDPKFLERLYLQAPNANKSLDVRYGASVQNQHDQNDENNTHDADLRRRLKYDQIARFNEQRCSGEPIYGQDFLQSMAKFSEKMVQTTWAGGFHACYRVQCGLDDLHTPAALKEVIYTPTKLIDSLKYIFERYIVYVPSAYAPDPEMQIWHPNPSTYWGRIQERKTFALHLNEPATPLHHIASSMITQFPHPRLIQYDCGKLQTLDRLLRRLKNDSHRVLIFTQMTKMLDVLEAFLNFHGHIYLRLDGSTRIDQRQILMERFNGDPKIFVFILSTRSGGVGVNLTGADTVIFYDSDWNPTMDAQAQDRCHRIGQTRDVHIYRLVSEMTIEENILKKANQKRLLGDLAIEGGNFTTAYFKNSTIQDLFNIDQNESAATRMSEVVECNDARERHHASETPTTAGDETNALGALETALASAEDDQDVVAACSAKAEAVAELAEFDENIPLEKDEDKEEKEKEPELSKAEQEVVNLMQQLTPIERYAMRFIEETESAWSEEQLAAAEREIEDKKREWEENRLATLRDEEERRARELEEESELLTFSREDATNQIWVSQNSGEHMPMWCPPTPPQQDGDVYIDHTMSFLYDTSNVMLETQLPSVYIKKETKRTRVEAGLVDTRRPVKVIKREDPTTQPPKSIFNHLSMGVKIRRDQRRDRYRGMIRTQIPPVPGVKYPTAKPHIEQPGHNWTIHEDAAILKVIQRYQGLNLNLVISCTGHMPNWDFVADYVNTVSSTYRSPKQCRNRYESVLVPREEGKQVIDNSPRKKKQKTALSAAAIPYKFQPPPKSNRSTAQLYLQDNNGTFNTLMSQRYDALKLVTAKKPVPQKAAPTASSIALKNPKHESILTEHGIDLDHPLTAVEIAAKRAERNRDKKIPIDSHQLKHIQLVKLQAQQAAQQAQQAAQQAAAAAALAAAAQGDSSPNSATASTSQLVIQQQQQQVQPVAQTVQVTTVQTVVSTVATTTPNTPPSNPARIPRIVASPLQSQAVVSVPGINPAQLQTQRLIVPGPAGQTKVATGTTVTAKQLSAAQLQLLRNAALKRDAHMRLQSAGGTSPQALKTTAVVSIPAQSGVQVQFSQAQARAHIIKGGTVAVGNKQVTRQLTESDIQHLLKLQSQKNQSQKVAAGQATTIASPHVYTQTLQAGPSGTQVATIVKTVSTSGVTQAVLGTPVKALPPGIKTPQQIRALQLQHLMAQKKMLAQQQKIAGIAQVTGKGGVATQLIVGSKPLTSAITMQQFQQVMRSPLAVPQGPVVLATKGNSRIIPVNAGPGTKPTIQVMNTASPGLTTTIRPPTSTTLTAASLAGIKVQGAAGTSHAQQQALLSQVSAVLGQNVRQGGSPVRIQTATGTPVAVTVHQAPQQATTTGSAVQQQQQPPTSDKSTDNVSRFVKKP